MWDVYEEFTELRNKTSRLRLATFITCIGKEALKVHNGLPFQSDEEKADINKVLELWANHCIGKTNIIYERYKFNNRSQEQTETIDTYNTTLRALAETCEFEMTLSAIESFVVSVTRAYEENCSRNVV